MSCGICYFDTTSSIVNFECFTDLPDDVNSLVMPEVFEDLLSNLITGLVYFNNFNV